MLLSLYDVEGIREPRLAWPSILSRFSLPSALSIPSGILKVTFWLLLIQSKPIGEGEFKVVRASLWYFEALFWALSAR